MNSLPTTIEELFEELRNEINWLHAKWIIYRELFDHSEERVDLLNECASAFFCMIDMMNVIYKFPRPNFSALPIQTRTTKRRRSNGLTNNCEAFTR